MEKKDRISLLDAYYESIILLHDKEEIEKALPNTEYDNFEIMMNGLIEKLRQEKENIILNMKDYTEKEKELLAEPELKELNIKLNICQEKINQEKKKKEEEKKLEEKSEIEPVKHLIFATTPLGNVCVEEDLKDIPKEFYERFYQCLYETEQNIKNGNTKKGRLFTNNKDLEGITERKDFQVRVCYRHLTPNTEYIEIVKTKKSINDKKDREEIKNRDKFLKEEYQLLLIEMKDEIKKQKIIDRNKEIRNRIYETLGKSKGETK